MEILNDIWNILSTPNETLITIFSIPLSILENFLGAYLIIIFLNIKTSSEKFFQYVFFVAFVSLFTMLFIPTPFNLFINYIFIYALIHYILKLDYLKSLIGMLLPTIVFGLTGSLIANPLLQIIGISSEQLAIIPIYRLSYMSLMYLLVFIIILFFKTHHLQISFLDDIDKKTKIITLINFLLGIFAIVFQTIITFYYIDNLPIIITFFSFLSLFLYFSISFYSLTRVMQLSLTTRKLQSAEEYNNTLRVLHDNVRSFKHDFDNIVTTIGGYIRTNDMEGLKKYYVELEDDCQRVNNLYLLNPNIVNNDGIYNLLTKKYNEAESKDIKVNISFLLDLSTLNMKIYEFARILGILLDNAIEASEECDEKIINLTFRNDSRNNRQLIIIENTYKNKDVDLHEIFGKGISEKENHTGLGLWEVDKLVKKNHNVHLVPSKNDKFFSQQLEIYK